MFSIWVWGNRLMISAYLSFYLSPGAGGAGYGGAGCEGGRGSVAHQPVF